MSDSLRSTPVTKTTTTTVSRRVSYRWGSELGDTTEIGIGASGDRCWLSGKRTDLNAPSDFMRLLALSIIEVLDEAALPPNDGSVAS